MYEVESKIFRTDAAIYTAVVVEQRICPNRPNCEFRVLLRRFAATAWKRAKTSSRTLARKLKARRFDNVEEIQAESQRMLDTLTEKDFQEAFEKWRKRWDRCLYALPWGWRRPIGLMVRFMIFTTSVQNIWDTLSYVQSHDYRSSFVGDKASGSHNWLLAPT
jgi:hypothetical protein